MFQGLLPGNIYISPPMYHLPFALKKFDWNNSTDFVIFKDGRHDNDQFLIWLHYTASSSTQGYEGEAKGRRPSARHVPREMHDGQGYYKVVHK